MERLLRLQESARIRPDVATPESPGETRGEGLTGDALESPKKELAMTSTPDLKDEGLTNKQLSETIDVPVSTIEKWKSSLKRIGTIKPRAYPTFKKEWAIGESGLWYRLPESP